MKYPRYIAAATDVRVMSWLRMPLCSAFNAAAISASGTLTKNSFVFSPAMDDDDEGCCEDVVVARPRLKTTTSALPPLACFTTCCRCCCSHVTHKRLSAAAAAAATRRPARDANARSMFRRWCALWRTALVSDVVNYPI